VLRPIKIDETSAVLNLRRVRLVDLDRSVPPLRGAASNAYLS